jgi:hypothetical protein
LAVVMERLQKGMEYPHYKLFEIYCK